MKILFRFTFSLCLLAATALSASAAFSSLYVFGDGLSTTTDPGSLGYPLYYGQRYSNGRVWVEVLAQRQGLTYNANNNNSYFDQDSADVVGDVNSFTPPANVTNDLFIVWVCNSDTWEAVEDSDNSAQWTDVINQSQANHLQIITNLYAKGVRTLILPNAVDISEVPQFNQDASQASVMHNGCIAYNVAFSNTVNQAIALCPGLKIYTPDFFTLLNNVLANPAAYGLINVLYNGQSVDALDAANFYPSLPAAVINGYGTNYVFWDPLDPTAEFHEVIADVTQQIISPVNISKLAVLNGSNRLDVVNMPVGLSGFADGCTNLAQPNWAAVQSFNSTNTTQSIFVSTSGSSGGSPQLSPSPADVINPASGPGDGSNSVVTAQFYKLQFPYAWSWP
jgi:phospholipase/lecithinase/hemolysin